ncbi:MAG: hypothetical protein GX410_03655 [Elusimicrobia bacterium]|nr:hypothetical protein [Elusimicrobiota bacterium]
MSAKKEEQTAAPAFNLEKAMMDYSGDKYELIVMASILAAQKGKNEEFRFQPRDKVIKASLAEYLAGKITREQLVETYMSERKLMEEKQAQEEKRLEQKAAAPRLELKLSGESL